MNNTRITVDFTDGPHEVELSELEQHMLRRLCDVLGFDPSFAFVVDGCGRGVFEVYDEDGEMITAGETVSRMLVDALYRLASDATKQLSELRDRVYAYRRAHKHLLDG